MKIIIFYFLINFAILGLAYQVFGFLPIEHQGDTIGTALMFSAVSFIPHVFIRWWRGQYERVGQITNTLVAVVLVFNMLISFPAVVLSLETDRYHFNEALREGGIFIP